MRSYKNSSSGTDNRASLIITYILCLVAAFAIWLYVVNISTDEYEKTFTVDIVLEGTEKLSQDAGMSVYDQTVSRVSVTVCGQRNDIQSLSESSFRAYLDVASYTEGGKHSAPVRISAPQGTSIVSYTPESVDVYLDTITSSSVRLEVSLSEYSVASGYEISDPVLEFDTVTVTGPKTTLDLIKNAVAVVDLGSGWITSSFEHHANIKLISTEGKTIESSFVTLDKSVVKVNFDVIQEKSVRLTYSLAEGTDASRISSVVISPGWITVRGKAENCALLEQITAVTVSAASAADSELDISSLILPDGITAVTEGKIRVHIVFAPEESETAESTTAAVPETEKTPEGSSANG